jgi:hypothetical protein
MDPISSANAGSVAPLTTSQPSSTGANAPGSARATDGAGVAAGQAGPYASTSTTAGQAEIPETPGGAPDHALGQEVLDRAFAAMTKLENELKGIDPTSPEGAKRLAEITRQLNRIDEMIHMINEMRKDRHDANMAVIANIAS